MNNKIVIGVVLTIIIIGSVFYFTQKQYQPNQQQQAVQQPQTQVAENTITIQNFSFSPETLTVPQGTKVTWVNRDTAVHTINSDAFNSPDLHQGDTFEFVFNSKGSFDYICGLHPSMTGNIVVE